MMPAEATQDGTFRLARGFEEARFMRSERGSWPRFTLNSGRGRIALVDKF